MTPSTHDTALVPGTLVWREDVHLGLVSHFGIVLQTWPCYVAHIDKSQTGHLRVKVEPFEAFTQGRQVWFEPVVQPVSLEDMWTRVNAVAQAKKPFGLLCWGEDWNCESFARFVKSGLPHSEQATSANKVLFGVAVVGALAALVSSATSSDTSSDTSSGSSTSFDAKVGRFRDRKGRFAAR
jgi:hypothetical protein